MSLSSQQQSIIMKFILQIFLAIGLAPFAFAQNPSPASSASPSTAAAAGGRTDVYHVHFAQAAVGKAKELGEELKKPAPEAQGARSEEHTSELQSRLHLVCRL